MRKRDSRGRRSWRELIVRRRRLLNLSLLLRSVVSSPLFCYVWIRLSRSSGSRWSGRRRSRERGSLFEGILRLRHRRLSIFSSESIGSRSGSSRILRSTSFDWTITRRLRTTVEGRARRNETLRKLLSRVRVTWRLVVSRLTSIVGLRGRRIRTLRTSVIVLRRWNSFLRVVSRGRNVV